MPTVNGEKVLDIAQLWRKLYNLPHEFEAERSFDRSYNPMGAKRQLLATQPSVTSNLATTLVSLALMPRLTALGASLGIAPGATAEPVVVARAGGARPCRRAACAARQREACHNSACRRPAGRLLCSVSGRTDATGVRWPPGRRAVVGTASTGVSMAWAPLSSARAISV